MPFVKKQVSTSPLLSATLIPPVVHLPGNQNTPVFSQVVQVLYYVETSTGGVYTLPNA
ncbi:hypothetical protein ACSS6W_002193 [Trichoderma asperelloides]